jgi:hypothetical protein
MTFEEITNPKKFVRVADSTRSSCDEPRAMIGGEFEVRAKYYCDNTVSVWNKDKSNCWIFNRSDVRFLTPVEFNGKRIAIGDEVESGRDWYLVYGYHWFDGRWRLDLCRDNDCRGECYWLSEEEITAHRTEPDNEVEKAIQLLKDKGRIRNGMIVE